ncbi:MULTISPECIES: hypothetical protein [unclassified Pseudomonas]|uniref:hypothetical protein n=1 Tax=unclassified Pseudomonas TaxID=196821 RepID=UPI001C60E87F|nr:MULTISPECIES: hypothetical protein [unclassified Pseudomonas]MBW5416122.1 hypothetical protein [Pseudomonas sp. MAG002Y]
MIKVESSNLGSQLAFLTDLEQNQLPYAMALALTRTAQEAKAAIEQEMQSVFDRPTRYTMNSLRLIPAKKNRLEARVWVKDEADKAAPATKWLTPEVYGGSRPDKRSEAMLKARGILPQGKYVVPGKGAQLDQFGNMKRGQLTKALSGIGGFTEVGYSANATDSSQSRRKGNAKRFFVMRNGKVPIGIAQRTGRKKDQISILLAFVDKPRYGKRLDFFGVGQRVIDERIGPNFELAMTEALQTRRK